MNNENKEQNGVRGFCGPNDGGYIHDAITKAATHLKAAMELYSQGHYPHSNAKVIPQDHPFRDIMNRLAELDNEYARFANKEPNPEFFSVYEPPYEDTIRWDLPQGPDGKY